MWHLPQGENQQRGLGWLIFLFSLCLRILASQVLVVSANLNSSFSLSSPGRCQSLLACLLLSRGLYLLYLTSQSLAFEAEGLVYTAKEVAAWRMLTSFRKHSSQGLDLSSPVCPKGSWTTSSIWDVSHPSFLVLGELHCSVTSYSVVATSRGSHWLDIGWYWGIILDYFKTIMVLWLCMFW